jgi:hypothetical protein
MVGWWQKNREGFRRPPGALKSALSSTRPQSGTMRLPADLSVCFPPLDPAFVESLSAKRRADAEASASVKRVRDEMVFSVAISDQKQLEFDWEKRYGKKLDEMPDEELFALVLDSSTILYAKKYGRGSPLVRPLLLAAVARFFGGSAETVVSMKS